MYNAPRRPYMCVCAQRQAASTSRTSSQHPACGFLTHPTLVLLITESWQCYRSGSVNILCDMLISWGNVWLTDRDGHWSSDWSVVISLSSLSLFQTKFRYITKIGCGHQLWPEVNIWNIWHCPMFYYCIALLVHYVFILHVIFHLIDGD